MHIVCIREWLSVDNQSFKKSSDLGSILHVLDKEVRNIMRNVWWAYYDCTQTYWTNSLKHTWIRWLHTYMIYDKYVCRRFSFGSYASFALRSIGGKSSTHTECIIYYRTHPVEKVLVAAHTWMKPSSCSQLGLTYRYWYWYCMYQRMVVGG